MKIGTKSVLFGAHAFWLHPWFVAAAWWKLYGFPTELWLWIAFFVHDLGYWGKPNIDGEEGEQHPIFGANVLYQLEWWLVKRGWKRRMSGKWGNECLYHSRFWAKKRGMTPSKLCWADKLAVAWEPWWLYYIRIKLTGEINEYRHVNTVGRRDMPEGGSTSEIQWVHDIQRHCKRVALEKVHAPA